MAIGLTYSYKIFGSRHPESMTLKHDHGKYMMEMRTPTHKDARFNHALKSLSEKPVGGK
jgi:hypothetical protein